jgi:proteasome lid subunit RPN8/RPN11
MLLEGMATVRITDKALHSLTQHSMKGYQRAYKKEVGGFLLGEICGKNYCLAEAVPYNTRNAGRTYWDPDAGAMKRKGAILEKQTGHKWIGSYHSHPETAGHASTRQSDEDKASHKSSEHVLEIIIRVGLSPMKSSASCLTVQDGENGFRYDICGHIKDGDNRIRRIKVERA